MKLALDHHYSTRIAVALRDRGHDVVAAVESGWHTLEDDELLDTCHREGRTLLTNNVADFAVLARQRATERRAHHGLVFTSDASLPRTRDTIGQYVNALDGLMTVHADDRAFVDQIHWL